MTDEISFRFAEEEDTALILDFVKVLFELR